MLFMKIVLAPQSFKGSYTGQEVCELLSEGILKAHPEAEIVQQPVADGGDGTLDILVYSRNGTYKEVTVLDSQQNDKVSSWGYFSDTKTAFIESASICGIASLAELEKKPLTATSYGVGQCIKQVLDEGIRHIVIGLGGSATNDGGTGLLSTLGVRFLDAQGTPLPQGGGYLGNLASVDISGLDSRLQQCRIEVACDVDNPLLGPQGATMVYSEQKGASDVDKDLLESGLTHFAALTKRSCGVDIAALSYGGAAGGMAAGLHAYIGAELISGADLVLDLVGFDKLIEGADLVITGEGRIDGQTVYNKAPIVVAKRAKQRGIKVIAVTGYVGDGYEAVFDHGIDAVYPIGTGGILMTIEKALSSQ